MKKTSWWILGAFALFCGTFLASPGLQILLEKSGFWVWRNQSIMLTGVAALVFMTLTMLIAIRPAWLDRATGGLDKAYGLHKWAGIFASITLILHWLGEKGPKWMVQAGWLERPIRAGSKGEAPWWFELGKTLGEWGFYALLVLVVVALFQRIPYRFFRYIHKALAVVFVAGAFHAVTMLPASWWQTPAGFIVAALALGGTIAAFLSLAQRIGATRKTKATISEITLHANGLIDLSLKLSEKGMTHRPGQFAFLTFNSAEGPHPFTIASPGDDPHQVRFVIKPLGDFTRTLAAHLQTGQIVQLEGPYGQFDFRSDAARQVWVAGGIGITPFLAQLEHLAQQEKPQQNIDLWYCVKTRQEANFPPNLDELCQRAGITLHRTVAEDEQRLDAKQIKQQIQDLSRASVWFCGPQGFAQSLKKNLLQLGLSDQLFHSERFAMR